MVYAFFEKVSDGNMSLPENTRKLIVLLSNLQHLLIGTSKFVANAYLPNQENFRFVDDACGSRKTVNVISEDGEKGLSDMEVHIRIVQILPNVSGVGGSGGMRFFVVFVVTPHVFNLRRAVDLSTGEPGSNQPQVNVKNAERRKMWQEIIQSTFSLNARTLGVPEFKCVISGTNQQDSFTSMFNLGGAFLRMRQHAQNLWGLDADQVYVVGWEPPNRLDLNALLLEKCIAGYHQMDRNAGLWDEEWTENFNAHAALRGKPREEFACTVPGCSFDMVPALEHGQFPFCPSVMFFLGTGHHCSDDFPLKEVPEIVADFMRKQLLPGDVSAQLLGVGDCLDPAGYISVANADKIVYARQEHEETGMKAKKSLSTYTHLHSVVTQLDEGKRVEVDFSLMWNSVLYVVSECNDGVRYSCPDVLHRLAAFKPKGAMHEARARASRALTDLVGRRRGAALAAFMQPTLAAHLLADAALQHESEQTDTLNPGNMHIVLLLYNNAVIGILDYGEGAIKGASNGIGTGLIVCDGGGAYAVVGGADKDGAPKRKIYMNKTNSTGADFAVGRFKALVNPATYVPGLLNIELETVSDFTQHGVRVDCSDVYKEGLLFKRATQRRVNYNFFLTELQFTKDSAIENTLVDIVVRETSDNATKTRMSTAKSDADARGALKYFFVNRPRVSLLSSNNVPAQAYERMRTLTEVLRMTCSAVWGLRGDLTGVVAGNRASSASALDSSRWMFLDTLAVAATVALVQREGLLGSSVAVLDTAKSVWFVFSSELVRMAGFWCQRFQDERAMKRLVQQCETRGVMRSLLALSGGAFFTSNGDGVDDAVQGVAARVAGRFRSNCLHPSVLPSVMCDLLDQMLDTTSLLLISVLANDLRVPVVDEDVLLRWFSSGALESESEGVRLLQQWWAEVHATHCFVDADAPGAVYVSLPGRMGEQDAYAPAFGARDDAQGRTGARRPAYECSAFQTEKREHDQRGVVCARLALQLFSAYGKTLEGAALVQQDFLYTELMQSVDRETEFPYWYGVDGARFNDVHGLLAGAGLHGVHGVAPQGGADATPRHVTWKLVGATAQRPALTLGVDLRVLLWFVSVVGRGNVFFSEQCISQHCKSSVACSMVAAFYRNKVPSSMCPFPCTSSGLPDPRGGGILPLQLAAGRAGRRGTLYRPLDEGDRPFLGTADSVRVCAPDAMALRRPVSSAPPRLVCGTTPFFVSQLVEDVAPCEEWMRAASHLALSRLRMLPVHFFQSTAYLGEWMPALSRETGDVVAYHVDGGGEAVCVRIATVDGVTEHAVDVSCCGFMELYGLLPLPRVCRTGAVVCFEGDAGARLDRADSVWADVVGGADVGGGGGPRRWGDGVVGARGDTTAFAVVGPDAGGNWFGSDLCYSLHCGGEVVARVGVSELHASLAPYGTHLCVDFELAFEHNLLRAGVPGFLLPFVHPSEWSRVGLWVILTQDAEGGAAGGAEGGAQGGAEGGAEGGWGDGFTASVDELTILGDVCDRTAAADGLRPTVQHRRVRWALRAAWLRHADAFDGEMLRGCYFL